MPVHLRPRLLLLVLLGGVAGAELRYGLATVLRGSGVLPTLLANLSGALLLGLLLELLARWGPDEGVRLDLRLGLGSGVLGAYTTYSTLATEVALHVRDGRWAEALAYGLGTVAGGLVAAGLGVAAARALRP